MRRATPLDEFQAIRRLVRTLKARRTDVALGVGDDAALVRVPAGSDLVLALDTLVEDVHFPARTAPADIGWKALAVNLSDLAAMGATPTWALLGLTLPGVRADWLDGFARGFGALARRHGVDLVGGDTTRGRLTISVQLSGFVARGRALRRDGARAGDAVYVSGTLGDAAAGLELVQGNLAMGSAAAAKALRRRLDRPTPRVALGQALVGVASAAIDVSDGLVADLGHVLAASGVGADIAVPTLPASPALRRALPDFAERVRRQLHGGDDYELLFTVPSRRRAAVEKLSARLGLPLTQIGTIARRRGLRLTDEQGRAAIRGPAGWNHFG